MNLEILQLKLLSRIQDISLNLSSRQFEKFKILSIHNFSASHRRSIRYHELYWCHYRVFFLLQSSISLFLQLHVGDNVVQIFW